MPMRFVTCLLLFVTSTLTTYAQPDSSGVSSESPFHTWDILRKSQPRGLLHGLVQRLDAALVPDHHSESMWIESSGPSRLILGIKTEGDVNSEIHVGFFRDARWWYEDPVYIRIVPKAGVYEFSGIEPGKYFVGAMAGALPIQEAVGVHLGWPVPVEVSPDTVLRVRVLVSRDIDWETQNGMIFTRIESRHAGFLCI